MPPSKKTPPAAQMLVPVALIERCIYLIRGHKVMLDFDLAELYDVPTRAFNQAVKRNLERFPDDFMFQLSKDEADALRSQIVTLKPAGRGQHSKYRPYAFTEQGVAMLSSVLRSPRAIEVNIAIMRTFVQMREMLASNEELNRKFAALVQKLAEHDKYFRIVFDELKKLNTPPDKPRRPIGFKPEDPPANP